MPYLISIIDHKFFSFHCKNNSISQTRPYLRVNTSHLHDSIVREARRSINHEVPRSELPLTQVFVTAKQKSSRRILRHNIEGDNSKSSKTFVSIHCTISHWLIGLMKIICSGRRWTWEQLNVSWDGVESKFSSHL